MLRMLSRRLPFRTRSLSAPIEPRCTGRWNCRPRERGSIAVLTLIGIGLVAAAFLYVAVIGSRANEKLRARTAADASALASATVKAKIMNYESFILLADSALLPLGQITENIRTAQATALGLCSGVAIFVPTLWKYCAQYVPHVIRTYRNQPKVNKTVTQWLDGLEAMAKGLIEVGPLWAEGVSMAVGMSSAYRSGKAGVSYAAALPSATSSQECRDLGIELIDNNTKVQDRDACHDLKYLEFLYLFAHFKPIPFGMDVLGMTLTGNLLTLGAKCDKKNQVPQLKRDWKKQSYSHGMALVLHPSDEERLRHLESLRDTQRPQLPIQRPLLGMGCAEHYSEDHRGEESLWHMDWRARLVPCRYEDPQRVAKVTRCAGAQALFRLAFENERRLNITKDWKF